MNAAHPDDETHRNEQSHQDESHRHESHRHESYRHESYRHQSHRHDESLDVLVLEARSGSERAFTRLWEQLRPAVAGYLRGRGVPEIDDVTSEVFLAAFGAMARFDGDGAAFRRWLFTIAHHRAVDAFRHHARHGEHDSYDGECDTRSVSSAESEALGRIHHQAALRLVHRLAADQREVLLLRVVAELSVEEVAQVMSRSADAVRQLHRRALRSLRELAAELVG